VLKNVSNAGVQVLMMNGASNAQILLMDSVSNAGVQVLMMNDASNAQILLMVRT